MDCDQLTAEMKERILNVLAELRKASRRLEASIPESSTLKGFHETNWHHTLLQVEAVLYAALRINLKESQLEDAILASAFSEAIRMPSTDQQLDNFIVHNVDGALAATEVLSRYFNHNSDGDRVRVIAHCVREHQASPPQFMADFTTLLLEDALEEAISGEQTDLIESIATKIAHPVESPRAEDVDGASRLVFSDAERKVLSRIGVEHWFVPNPESPWYNTSQAVITANMLVGYATPHGLAELVASRAPGEAMSFEDATIFESVEAAQASYKDACALLDTPAWTLMHDVWEHTQDAFADICDDMEGWFGELEGSGIEIERNPDGTIPFWDAPLKYPTSSELNPSEQAQFDFAETITLEVVRRLKSHEDTSAIFFALLSN